jgi:hypothetical protein
MEAMKTIIISFVILLVTFSESVCQQRMIAARDEFHVAVLYNTPIGPKTIGVEPSLLANMEPGLSVDVHYMTTVSRNFQLGGWVGFAGFDEQFPVLRNFNDISIGGAIYTV